jgi:hypothetical protein
MPARDVVGVPCAEGETAARPVGVSVTCTPAARVADVVVVTADPGTVGVTEMEWVGVAAIVAVAGGASEGKGGRVGNCAGGGTGAEPQADTPMETTIAVMQNPNLFISPLPFQIVSNVRAPAIRPTAWIIAQKWIYEKLASLHPPADTIQPDPHQ